MQIKFVVFPFLMLGLCLVAKADQASVDIPEKYKAYASEHKDVVVNPEQQARVKALMESVNSPEWQARQQNMTQRIQQSLAGGKTLPNDIDQEHEKVAIPKTDRVVLFISESIPIHVLRRYAKDLAKIHGVMVLRGMKGGIKKLQPTVRLIGDIVRVDPDCTGAACKVLKLDVIVDPVLFRDNNVTSVPAMAFIGNMEMASYCERGPDANRLNAAADVVYGDASLVGMLKALDGIRRDLRVETLIDRLEGINRAKS